MNYLYALILGIVEGLTEFLPVSSTAHLILTAKLLGIAQNSYWTFFEVFIQSGAILAIFVAFVKKLRDKKLVTNLVYSFIPTAIVGLALHKIIKTYFFENVWLIIGALIAFALVFLFLEYFIKTKRLKLTKKTDTLTWKEAVILGLWQALAVVPGVSRAGAVMVGAMSMGYTRAESALYSFMLALPTICAATLLDLIKTDTRVVTQNIGVSMVGFVTAFVSAYAVARWLIGYLQKHTLSTFAWYRIALALFALFMFI